MSSLFSRILKVFRVPPPYVSLISNRWIFVSGDIDRLGSLSNKVESIPNLYGARGIRYSDEKELSVFLSRLNAAGVCFLEDFKLAKCPCSLMSELRDEGMVDEFRCISWTGKMRTMVVKKIGT